MIALPNPRDPRNPRLIHSPYLQTELRSPPSTPAEWHQRKIHFNCNKIVSGTLEIVLVAPDFFLARNVERFHTRSVSTAGKSALAYLKWFWCTRFFSPAEC